MTKIFSTILIILLLLPQLTFAACGGKNKALYSKCCRDQECASSYCNGGHCLVWGDQHVLRDPQWGARICRGRNKAINDVCCYNSQCRSNWCAFGLCSKFERLSPMPKDRCGPNCRW